MLGSNRKVLTKSELLSHLIEIRKESTNRTDLFVRVNDWFLMRRLTRYEKQQAFRTFSDHFNKFQPILSMGEMTDMWYLCEMYQPAESRQTCMACTYQVQSHQDRACVVAPAPGAFDRQPLST